MNELAQKIMQKSYTDGHGDCWWFDGSLNAEGYGKIWWDGKMVRAHRASYAAHHGEIPHDWQVHHTCHNPSCVHPYHLVAMTHYENQRERAVLPKSGYAGVSLHGSKYRGRFRRMKDVYYTRTYEDALEAYVALQGLMERMDDESQRCEV